MVDEVRRDVAEEDEPRRQAQPPADEPESSGGLRGRNHAHGMKRCTGNNERTIMREPAGVERVKGIEPSS